MRKHTTALIGLAALVAACGSASAQVYRLGVGNGLSWGIADNGATVGDTTAGGPYWMWTEGAGRTTIGGWSAGNSVGGTPKVSNDGMWVGGTAANSSGVAEMSRYEVSSGTWTNLGSFGHQIDSEVSSGWGMSGDGQSVAGLSWHPDGGAHAVQWTVTDGFFDLGSTVDGSSSRANCVDFDGNVVGGWQDGNGRQGAVWVDGMQELLVRPDGQPASEVQRITNDGLYATGMDIGPRNGIGNAYRYNIDTDTYEALPNLAIGGGRYMSGNGITADGMMVGGGTWTSGPATWGNAWLWRDGVGTVDLPTYLTEVGVAFNPDFHFSFISDIASDGDWITGWGYEGTFGNTESFVIHIPTPASAMLLGLGGLVATRRRR